MAIINLPADFKEFLRLLDTNRVEYLLVGGYAVAFHGYPRSTADMDIWIAIHPENAERIAAVLIEFGFGTPEMKPGLFLERDRIIRMGMPPYRIEILTTVSGVEFSECYTHRVVDDLDGTKVSLIDLAHLKLNKKAAGRHKDLDDLENLP